MAARGSGPPPDTAASLQGKPPAAVQGAGGEAKTTATQSFGGGRGIAAGVSHDGPDVEERDLVAVTVAITVQIQRESLEQQRGRSGLWPRSLERRRRFCGRG
ncbi:hypothetical protein ZWY2020_019308 [Hordeum vulgare]|nr:hypothetical protein ZWY2020_008476 [Hordeum vulgare]KAI4986678.1 hypothetical protein ZWY2020_019308 [Hordeum vulgare]